MSTVILDTITGKSTATTITIGSTPVVSASANSMTIRGEGSAQTSIQQGLAKAWVHYDQRVSVGIKDSLNVSSVADSTTGHNQTTMTNAMGNVLYTHTTGGSYDASITNSSKSDIHYGFPSSTTVYQSGSHNQNGTLIDSQYNLSVIHGDLA